jgi:hypothetical protein
VETIRLAILTEARSSEVSLADAAMIIAAAAQEFSVAPPDQYSYYQRARISRTNVIDRFWFEDALWRDKECYQRWLAKVEEPRRTAVEIIAPVPTYPPPGPHQGSPWQKILAVLEERINRHSFETWLKPTRYSHVSNDVLFVRVPTAEFRCAGEKYADLIQQAIDDLGLSFQDVQFVVTEAISP